MIKAVIFDHTVLSNTPSSVLPQLKELLETIRSQGIKIVSFANRKTEVESFLRAHRMPELDFLLTRSQIFVNKGSGAWVRRAATELGLSANTFCYIGDDDMDWLTATKTPIFYLHAGWVQPTSNSTKSETGPIATTPHEVHKYLSYLLCLPLSWQYTLDVPEHNVIFRALLDHKVSLPATLPKSFVLRDIYRDKINVTIAGDSAEKILILHALINLQRENLLEAGGYFCVYPGSTPDTHNPTLTRFLNEAYRYFNNFNGNDLLVRHKTAIDTSDTRARIRRGSQIPEPTYFDQANTVSLNPIYEEYIEGKTVIIFDDFSTTGHSLDWTRNLLLSAGVGRVVLVAIGKYGEWYHMFTPKSEGVMRPFSERPYNESDFAAQWLKPKNTPENGSIIRDAVQGWRDF